MHKTAWGLLVGLLALGLLAGGCDSGGGGSSITLSLRSAPMALGNGEAPALLFSADGYTVAWDAPGPGGSNQVHYRRFVQGVPGADTVAGGGAAARLAAVGSQVGIAWLGAEPGTGDDEVFFALAEAGAPAGVTQVTMLPASSDFPSFDLARLEGTWLVAVCHQTSNGGSLLVVPMEPAGTAMAAAQVAATRCKDVSVYPDGQTAWLAYTEADTVFVRHVSATGTALGGALRIGAAGTSGSGQVVNMVDGLGVVFHDGVTDGAMLQRLDRQGALVGSAAALDTDGSVAPTFAASPLIPGLLLAWRTGAGTFLVRAFDSNGAVDSTPLAVGTAAMALPRFARSANDSTGVAWSDGGMIMFAEIGHTR